MASDNILRVPDLLISKAFDAVVSTVSVFPGEVVPMPTLPPSRILARSVPPKFLNFIGSPAAAGLNASAKESPVIKASPTT